MIVSDASPLIALAAIGQLSVLRAFYPKVWIPEAVYQEIQAPNEPRPGKREIQSADWIICLPLHQTALAHALKMELDDGEAEAIALAIEKNAPLVLMDERKGRTIAMRMGLKAIGVVGVLVLAKHHGHIPMIKPMLDSLLQQAGFRLSDALYHEVLQTCGEAARGTDKR